MPEISIKEKLFKVYSKPYDEKEDSFIELKRIYDLSDNDALFLYDVVIENYRESVEHKIKQAKILACETFHCDEPLGKEHIFATDVLRELGYALPFYGFSVRNLEQKGWIKLINKKQII